MRLPPRRPLRLRNRQNNLQKSFEISRRAIFGGIFCANGVNQREKELQTGRNSVIIAFVVIKMSNEKMVKSITSMNEDFAKWYTDVCIKAELIDYSSVKGCMIIRPYGYAIWENIQRLMDERFKETGHENVYMPMFIPESLLQKEKDHVEGFAPEVAWVTHGGDEKLEERLCVRPTSETLFCDHFKNIVHSYRDLPVPAFPRVPLAGGSHAPCNPRRGKRGNNKNAQCLCRLCRGMSRNAGC